MIGIHCSGDKERPIQFYKRYKCICEVTGPVRRQDRDPFGTLAFKFTPTPSLPRCSDGKFIGDF